jgi:hypothetical protein
VRDTSPLSLVRLDSVAVFRQGGLERVGLSAEVSFTLVVDLLSALKRLSGVGLTKAENPVLA